MSNVSISNLPSVTSAQASSQVPAVQNGTTVYVTVDQIAKYTQQTYPITGITSITAQSPLSGGTITSTGTIGLNTSSINNTYLAPMASNTIKGNNTGSSANPTDLSVLNVQNMLGFGTTNANTVLANITGTGNAMAATSVTALFDSAFTSTQGSILYRNAGGWVPLGPSSPNAVLVSGGSGANISWSTLAGSGTVTSVATGTGLTGGPITTTGTISIANTTVTANSYGSASSVPTFTVNAQGQLTAASNTSIAISGTQITSGIIGSAYLSGSYTGITGVGTINAGTWNGSTIAVAYGGTGTTTSTGTGNVVLSNSPTLVTPALGTPTSGVMTNVTGLPLTTGVTGTLPIANGGTGITSLGTGVQTALGQAVTGSGSIVLATSPSLTTPTLGAASATSVAMTTGTISTSPSNATDIANKSYVDSVANGINFHSACNYATTADLGSVTYNNGASGVGATLTNAGTQAALVIDGHTFTSTDVTNAVRILVKNESNGAYNGIYVLTNQGSGSTNWSMVRATDYDTSGSGQNEIDQGDFVYVLSGTANANTSWVQQTPLPITVGTTALVWIQFGAQATYTAGTGLTLSSNQFSITNTAVTAGSYGSASTVPNYTVNAQGQLTAAASTAIAIAGSAITSGSVAATVGGTGQTSYTVGDLLYASTTTALSKLAAVSTGQVLVSAGTGTAPAYSATPSVTSITAPTHLGGTGTGSSLTLQSTSGVGATDSIALKVGNNGATTALSIATTGIVSFPTTGAIVLPASTTGNQPTGQTGMLRFNTTTTSFEGYNGSAWGAIGGGATGGGTDAIFWNNGVNITTSYSIPASTNSGTFGPIVISSSATITIPSSSTWTVI